MKILLLALLSCTAVLALSIDELKYRYGRPISETFLARPGIVVTASYGPKGTVTELVISPLHKGSIKSRGTTLSLDAAKGVIDELVPRSERDKFVSGELDDLECFPEDDCAGSSKNYERVRIYYNSAGQAGQVGYAVVTWK